MATKVKPTRLQVTGTPQAGDVPQYVDWDNFQWWSWSGITVVDNLNSTSATDALSANQWYVLNNKISDLFWLGKFLSLWDATTWLPTSFPLQTPYAYSTWDYYLVSTVSSATPPVNYRPTWSSYSWTASSTTESDELEVWDLYIYDGTTWLLQINHGKTVSFANLAWQPEDNAALDSALDAKQDALTLPANPTSWNLVTWWTDNETLVDGWAVPTVPTNVSAFSNDAGYITSASLPWTATSSTAWTVKLVSDTVQSESAQAVSSTANRTYGVQLNSSNQMVVNVPWTDSFNATNWGTKLFAFPDVSDDISDLVTWLTNWWSAIIGDENGYCLVTSIDTSWREIKAECPVMLWYKRTWTIAYNASKVVTSETYTDDYYFNPWWTATTGYVVTKTASGYEWQAPYTSTTATLAAANWSSKSITVSVAWVTATNTVFISPAPSSFTDYTNAVIYCSAQGSWTLTFSCDTEPSNDITVNVVIMN